VERNTSAAAERNKQPIADELAVLLPDDARVLEIASGTGQHAAHFAAAFPRMTWQPTDMGDSDLLQIEARRREQHRPNLLAPLRLDVLQGTWPVPADFDALLCINMIHISPWETTPALFAGAARHLRGASTIVLYGPYREGGRHTAPSNEAFESWLRSLDSRYGVRDLEEVEAVAATHGFALMHLARMPANNLLLGFRRG
jgi:SAM-dependent methyltransferase